LPQHIGDAGVWVENGAKETAVGTRGLFIEPAEKAQGEDRPAATLGFGLGAIEFGMPVEPAGGANVKDMLTNAKSP